MVHVAWPITSLRARYLMVWLSGSLITAGIMSLIGVGLYWRLVPVFADNLFYPMVVTNAMLLLVALQSRWLLFRLYASAVAVGMEINLLWAGCQMGDWRWQAGVSLTIALFSWLGWRRWHRLAEMKWLTAAVWVMTAVCVWMWLRPSFCY